MWQPITITASTCSGNTDFEAHIRLFDGWPTLENSTQLASTHPDAECGYLIHDLTVIGTYYLLVEGVDAQVSVTTDC